MANKTTARDFSKFFLEKKLLTKNLVFRPKMQPDLQLLNVRTREYQESICRSVWVRSSCNEIRIADRVLIPASGCTKRKYWTFYVVLTLWLEYLLGKATHLKNNTNKC